MNRSSREVLCIDFRPTIPPAHPTEWIAVVAARDDADGHRNNGDFRRAAELNDGFTARADDETAAIEAARMIDDRDKNLVLRGARV